MQQNALFMQKSASGFPMSHLRLSYHGQSITMSSSPHFGLWLLTFLSNLLPLEYNKNASLPSSIFHQTSYMPPPGDSRLTWTLQKSLSLYEGSPSLLLLSSFGRQDGHLGLRIGKTITFYSKKHLQKMTPSSTYLCKITRFKVFQGKCYCRQLARY